MRRLLRYVGFAVIAIALIGCDERSASSDAGQRIRRPRRPRPAPPPPPETSLPTSWTKVAGPVVPDWVASDPSIVVRDGLYRMYYTGIDYDTFRTTIKQATSDDGNSWTVTGTALAGRIGTWEERLEGACAVLHGSDVWLYYSGYRDDGYPVEGFPATLALATSSDGVTFARQGIVLEPTQGWYDSDAVYSPTLVWADSQYVMFYTGHCYTDWSLCGYPGVFLCAAMSPDGVAWTKRPTPIAGPGGGLSWLSDGLAEASLVRAPDGSWVLFFTGLSGEERVLGVAGAADLFGPWDLVPSPILTPGPAAWDGYIVIAPEVRCENGLWRMWYTGVSSEPAWAIGYAGGE